jgi:competence protein ComFB
MAGLLIQDRGLHMALRDEHDFSMLKNETEHFVIEEIEAQLADDDGCCRCSDCIMDIATMACNAVRPVYRYSLLGEQYAAQAMGNEDYAESVKLAVANAIAKVKANPSHD